MFTLPRLLFIVAIINSSILSCVYIIKDLTIGEL
nr:MAG TPA: hypothetical protein [Caudoviricetes sp.]